MLEFKQHARCRAFSCSVSMVFSLCVQTSFAYVHPLTRGKALTSSERLNSNLQPALVTPKHLAVTLLETLGIDQKVLSAEVLVVCTVVLMMLVISWSVFSFSSAKDEDRPALKVILLCASFGSCSWGMNVVNKSLVTSLQSPTLVTVAQMVMTVIGTLLLGRHKLGGSLKDIMKWSCVPLLFSAMLITSFFTLDSLTLTMMMLIRNMGPVITLPIETAIMPVDKRPTVSRTQVMALIVLFVSTFIYAERSSISFLGVGFAILNMFLAVTDRVIQRRLLTTECSGLSTETCMMLNNALGLAPAIALGSFLGDFRRADPKAWFQSSATLVLIISGLFGSGICYFGLAVQREITATSFMVLQNVVRMAVVIVGIAIFADPVSSRYQVLGMALSFAGALGYGAAAATAKKPA